MTPKAIPTRYKNYYFRSRTEARFAVYFDSLGWDWDYELEGFDLPKSGYYLPDFLVRPSASDNWYCSEFWLEVKGGKPTAEEESKLKELCLVTEKFGHFGNTDTFKRADGAKEVNEFCGSPQVVVPNWVFDRVYYAEQRFYDCNEYSPPADNFISDACATDLSVQRLQKAERAALSARFEHGEKPETDKVVRATYLHSEDLVKAARTVYEESSSPSELEYRMLELARNAGYNSASDMHRLLDAYYF